MSDVENAANVMAQFDGSAQSVSDARALSQQYYDAALAADGSGEFLIQLTGLIDTPFETAAI